MIDPVTLEVLRNRFDSIAEEIQLTLLRSSYSVILKEGEDCSAAVFSAAGEIIAQSTALPQHMGAFIPALARIVEEFPVTEMQPGDIFCMNDPHDGGTHLPDLVVAMPVVIGGRVVAFSVCLAHQEDIGGKVPGSMPTNSTEIFQEGLIIPPSQLHVAGVPNRTLFKLIERNVRLPRLVLGDIGAQIAAVTNGARRIEELFARFGGDLVPAYMQHLLDYAERLTRARIAEIPDGVYSFTDYMDNDGIDLDCRVPITATVTIRGDEAIVDYAGTSPQVGGPINAPLSGAQASAYFALRCVTDPGLPNNHGCYRPVMVRVPKGSLLDPWPGAPVAIRAHTLKRAADTVLGALVQAVPERVTAAPAGSISCVSIGGVRRDSRERFGLSDLVGGGGGARPALDGIDAIDTDVSNCMNVPAEAIEAAYPLRVLHYRLRRDGGGAGRTRGGTGYRAGDRGHRRRDHRFLSLGAAFHLALGIIRWAGRGALAHLGRAPRRRRRGDRLEGAHGVACRRCAGARGRGRRRLRAALGARSRAGRRRCAGRQGVWRSSVARLRRRDRRRRLDRRGGHGAPPQRDGRA